MAIEKCGKCSHSIVLFEGTRVCRNEAKWRPGQWLVR